MKGWRAAPPELWRDLLAEAGVTGDTADRISTFIALLGRWERAVNLIGAMSARMLVRHHVAEALRALPWLPDSGAALDIGSGNGFPIIPLLLARPGLHGVLLEPRERRWAFLREAARELGLDAEVRRERIQDHSGRGYAAATTRALGSSQWGGTIAPLLTDTGVLLWWRGGATAAGSRLAEMECVLTCALPDSGRGEITVWRRCFT